MTRIQELAELIERQTGTDGAFQTAIQSVSLHRASDVTQPHIDIFQPAVCLVAQGRKKMMLGETICDYDAERYLVISLDIPVSTEIVEATPEAPLLSALFTFDPALLSAVIMESDAPYAHHEAPELAISVSPLTEDLIDVFVRLLKLLATPRDVPVLAPLLEKELVYRLLQGDRAIQMSQLAFANSKLHRVGRAISFIKRHFIEPLPIEMLALKAGMSRSALHKSFHAVTGMSPLQYQKQLRLQEARRLMIRQNVDAATISHLVGYGSPSQFNREYKRLFGFPPHRDIANLRALGVIKE